MAGVLTGLLTKTVVRPWHLTLCGLLSAALAAGILMWQPAWSLAAAGLVLLAWFFDRADGQLARRQSTDSDWGTWLDANVDELVDLGMHVAMAIAAAGSGMSAAWPLLVAFLVGKYLLMYGLNLEADAEATTPTRMGSQGDVGEDASLCNLRSRVGLVCLGQTRIGRLLRAAYHLPANADVRVHLLVVALAGGWWIEELAMVAGYYNLRWMARYALVARRLGRLGR